MSACLFRSNFFYFHTVFWVKHGQIIDWQPPKGKTEIITVIYSSFMHLCMGAKKPIIFIYDDVILDADSLNLHTSADMSQIIQYTQNLILGLSDESISERIIKYLSLEHRK